MASLVSGNKTLQDLKRKAIEKDLTEEDILEAKKKGVPEGFLNHLTMVQKDYGGLLEEGELNVDWTGLGYQSIGGQNANISVRLTDEFIQAVKENTNWDLKKRKDGSVAKGIKAKDLWNKICVSAWLCGDPGVQYHTTINSWHTCPEGGEIRASNPCSEYMFLDDSACNLASLNLVKFEKNGIFQCDDFIHACRLWTLVLEISVSMAQYPSERIAKNSFNYRTIGLGFANLGALLMRRGLSYDSEEAREIGASIASLLGASAYEASTRLAKRYGPFKNFKKNKKHIKKIIKRHLNQSKSLSGTSEIREKANNLWQKALESTEKYGLRNAQVTAIAPTGTIGLVMDCDTTGIEPDYSLIKSKKVAGGGVLSLINQSVSFALKKLHYKENEIKEIEDFILENNSVAGAPHLKEKDYPVFDCAVGKDEQRVISFLGHLKMMAVIQPFISGAISKTINLPSSTSIETISQIFFQAHSLGLKSISIYRDGSKLSQPLTGESHLIESPYSREKCVNCGEKKLVLTGTCYRCENCGESTSCT